MFINLYNIINILMVCPFYNFKEFYTWHELFETQEFYQEMWDLSVYKIQLKVFIHFGLKWSFIITDCDYIL